MPQDVEKIAPLTLANTFIDKFGRGEGIQHMKLQKLAYYAHGWWLAFNDEPFLKERPQVWRYGPVFNSLYQALKSFGARPIHSPQKAIPFSEPDIVRDEKILGLVEWIWEKYSAYSAIELSNQTHETGTPWRKLAEEYEFCVPENSEIPDRLIKAYFQEHAKAVFLP